MSVDLSDLVIPEETRTLEIKNPLTGKPVLLIDLLSSSAEKPTEVRRRHEKKRFQNIGRVKLDPVQLEQESLDVLVACTVNWRAPEGGLPVFGGQELECTPSNVRMLYDRSKLIRDEVDRFVVDAANFLEKSPTSSQPS